MQIGFDRSLVTIFSPPPCQRDQEPGPRAGTSIVSVVPLGLGRVYFGQPPDLRPGLYYAAPSGLGRVAMLRMRFIWNSRGDEATSHGAIGLLPTLREKHATD